MRSMPRALFRYAQERQNMKIGIVGYGVVGRVMEALFAPVHELVIYDKLMPDVETLYIKNRINTCELVFVAVPTPSGADGLSCDTSIVEECVSWILPPICIRSTVPPGTTTYLAHKYDKVVVFCPEHLRETKWDEFKNEFVIIGGEQYAAVDLVADAFKAVLGANTVYRKTDAASAELSKYMLNCFLATKVAFFNTFKDIADAAQLDYDEVRELTLLDARVGRSHTIVTEERGYGGKCLPKDLRAMIGQNPSNTKLLQIVNGYNEYIRNAAKHS